MKPPLAPTFFAKEVTGARRFYRNLALSSGGLLKVVAGGIEHCGPTYCVERASFPFATIEYVARGHGELHMQGKRFDLGPGCVFAYDKGVPHRITSDARGTLVKYFVAFTGGRASRFLDECGLPAGRLAQVSPADALAALYEELVWAGARSDPRSDAYCRKILECLAVRLCLSLKSGAEHETASFRKYLDCRDYIERNFLEVHGAREIAGRCGVSEVHLCHLFRRYDHQTPYRLLIRLKMNYAAALIQQTDLLVKQAAQAVGYSDQFHFSRVFREFLGVPPSEWRRMNNVPPLDG